MSNDTTEPPASLCRLADAVKQRLDADGLKHRISFIPASETSSWRLSVDTDDGSVDLIFGNHRTDVISVVDYYQEDVSLELATEFVAMSLDLISEQEWREMLNSERQAAKTARSGPWTAFLRRSRRGRTT